jgi:hypothetical protein
MSRRLDPVRSALYGDEVVRFLDASFRANARTLVIGTVGFAAESLFFPSRLAGLPNADFRFFSEVRPDVPQEISSRGLEHEQRLRQVVGANLQVVPLSVCAPDGAPVAGRVACRHAAEWLSLAPYSDVVIDGTGMSRGTCFPVTKLLVELGRQRGFRVHLLLAGSDESSTSGVSSISSDRGDWVHGFQEQTDTDQFAGALKLWVVQLHEDSSQILERLFSSLQSPEEVCPIVPFPSRDPRRGDRLLMETRSLWQGDWGETPLSLIYADDKDPTDVFRTITELHEARVAALAGAGTRSVTILSPLGGRLTSVGMLLAALEYRLPMYYLETVGYRVSVPSALKKSSAVPGRLWCFRFM